MFDTPDTSKRILGRCRLPSYSALALLTRHVVAIFFEIDKDHLSVS